MSTADPLQRTVRMVVDPRTMIVFCYDANGTPLGTLYVRGMCETLRLKPTVHRTRAGSATVVEEVPVWDAPLL